MHRLQQFLTTVVLPQTEAYKNFSTNGKDEAKAIMLGVSIVESFLWLHLGTEIGAFPRPASHDIYATYLSPFFQSLVSRDAKARDEMKAYPTYVAHSDRSKGLLQKVASRFASILVEKAMRQEEIFSSEQAGFSQPGRLRPVFQTFLILHSRLVSNRSVETFTYQINFADDDEWRRNWREDCRPEEVMLADVDFRSTSSSICAGYLNLWNYAVKATMVAENFEGDQAVASDLFRLTDRLKEMEQWRINRKSKKASERFDDVRVRIMERLDEESTDSISEVCVREIRNSMDSAFSLWFSAAPMPVPQPV